MRRRSSWLAWLLDPRHPLGAVVLGMLGAGLVLGGLWLIETGAHGWADHNAHAPPPYWQR